MGNYKFISVLVYVLSSCLVLSVSCSHFGTKSNSWKKLKSSEARLLRLVPLQGRVEKSHHYSHNQVSTLRKNQKAAKLVNDRVEFDVSTELLLVDRGKAHLHYLVSTISKLEKEGKVDLHNLAFPEKGEALQYVLYPNASVYEVQDKPKDGVYYVPPISLPLTKVKAGDTWDMKHIWISDGAEKLPLKLELTSILKAFYKCPVELKKKNNRVCADIEISGNVEILGLNKKKVQFSSQLKGRIIFSVNQGSVLWSTVISSENLKTKDSDVKIKTCMSLSLYEPKVESLMPGKPHCDPQAESIKVPFIQ